MTYTAKSMSKATPPAKEKWLRGFRRRWGNMEIDEVPYYKTAFYEGVVEFIRFTRSQAYEEGYKKGVADEIECIETSGEHQAERGKWQSKAYEEGRKEAIEKIQKLSKKEPWTPPYLKALTDAIKAIKEGV